MNRIAALSACIAVLGLSQAVTPAQAQPPAIWSLAGAGCVPVGQTASTVGTFHSGGTVGFAEGKSGEIIVTCPVPSSVDRVSVISVTHRDSDGPGSAARVRSTLRQKSLETGGVSDVPGAVIDSNSFAATPVLVRKRRSLCFGSNAVVLNHKVFTYYIQVNLQRLPAAQAALSSVDLARTC